MKRAVLLALLFLLSAPVLVMAQEEDTIVDMPYVDKNITYRDPRISVEVFFNTAFHYLRSPAWLYEEPARYPTSWTYGGGLLFSKYFREFRLSVGISYTELVFKHRFQVTQGFIRDKINYLQIPVMLSYGIKWVHPFLGCIVSKPYEYNNVADTGLRNEINKATWFPSQGNTTPPDFDIQHKFLWSASIFGGICFKIPLAHFLNLNITPYYAYRTSIDVLVANMEPSHQQTLFDGHSSTGVQLGFEFVFFNAARE